MTNDQITIEKTYWKAKQTFTRWDQIYSSLFLFFKKNMVLTEKNVMGLIAQPHRKPPREMSSPDWRSVRKRNRVSRKWKNDWLLSPWSAPRFWWSTNQVVAQLFYTRVTTSWTDGQSEHIWSRSTQLGLWCPPSVHPASALVLSLDNRWEDWPVT